MTSARWMRRSTRVTTQAAWGKTSPQAEKALLGLGRGGFFGAEEERLLCVVAARDDLEEEVGVATVVREVADLVDAQKVRHRVTVESSCERRGGLLAGEIGKHVAGGGEADG